MGVRNKIIPGMRAHNGTDLELIEEEHRFTVRLWHHWNSVLLHRFGDVPAGESQIVKSVAS